MPLEKELQTYLRERPGWVAGGKFGLWVAISGDEVIGLFNDMDAALAAGYERVGLDTPFMVRQVAESEPPVQFSRRAVHVPPHNP